MASLESSCSPDDEYDLYALLKAFSGTMLRKYLSVLDLSSEARSGSHTYMRLHDNSIPTPKMNSLLLG